MTKTKAACKVEDTAYTSEMKLDLQTYMPHFHAFTNVERFKGITGDGRNRNMSVTESYKILKAEIGTYLSSFLPSFSLKRLSKETQNTIEIAQIKVKRI